MPLILKLQCSRKLNFIILYCLLLYECGEFVSAGIQILNDREIEQGHSVMLKEAEPFRKETLWLCLGMFGSEDPIKGWEGRASRTSRRLKADSLSPKLARGGPA